MSDAFIVISNDGTVVDKNETFKEVFQNIEDVDNVNNIFDYAKNSDFINYDNLINKIDEAKKVGNKVTIEYQITKDDFHKHFEVDIQPIKSKQGNECVATLLLLKDVTQHKADIETIEQKQDIIIKQSQLVTIGELAGGVAHDINTPISAIKSGILMFREMLGQRTENEMELLQRMDNCADKIIKIVNSMRNQIRNLGGTTNVEFKIVDVINDIKIISYNEVKKNNCELVITIEDDLSINGDPTKLGQVLTNLIVNAVQAYKGTGGKVEVILTKAPDNMALIKVIDYAGGMDESIKPYVFKNILTTKGTLGTGLGLYLAYSVIKGEFGGEITFESEVGVGTTFYVAIKRS
jgi:signal transduction histidine kinase